MKKVSPLLFLAVVTACSGLAIADPVTIQSGALSVTCNPDTQELTFSRDGKAFAEHVKWWEGIGEVATAKVVDVTEHGLAGKGIQIDGAQGTEQFALFEGVPFVVASVTRNAPNGPTKDIIPFSAPLTAKVTNFFSDEGNAAPKDTSAYFFLAAVNPQSRAGVVTGWLTHEIGSGIVGAKAGEQVTIEPRGEYGNRPIHSTTSMKSEYVAIGDFDDARLGLEALADANVKFNDIKIKPAMSGYCTWYHAHASNEKYLKALADFAKKQNLKDYGFDFLQIDDGWQTARRDFSDFKKDGPYPSGMKATAGNLTGDGFVAGIWLTPFAWDAKILKDHPEYFAKKAGGAAYDVKWAGDCFDMTNPAAQEYLSATVSRITKTEGYKYLKVDGLWSGMATTILYPNPQYKDDDYGGAVFQDKDATNLSAYRTGLRVLRKAAGDDVFICGCNVAQNHRTLGGSIGLLDAMRVGPDITAKWESIAGRAALFATREYFLNGRVWWNDPDCLMLRYPLTVEQGRTWGSFIAISGQLNVVSEDLAQLPAEKLDIVKRTMPNVPHETRPVDLFTTDGPGGDKLAARIWSAKVGKGEAAHEVVGLFNWDGTKPAVLGVDAKAVGLEDGEYVGFDYWENKFINGLAEVEKLNVGPGACHVISLVKSQNRPQLVSTSRHVLQGGPDIVDVSWDAASGTLKGTSKVVIGDPYELRISTGAFAMGDAKLSNGAKANASSESGHARVSFTPNATGQVSWEVRFTKK